MTLASKRSSLGSILRELEARPFHAVVLLEALEDVVLEVGYFARTAG